LSGHKHWSEVKHKRTVHVQAVMDAKEITRMFDELPPLLSGGGAGDPAVGYDHIRGEIRTTFQLSTSTTGEAAENAVELLASSIETITGERPGTISVELASAARRS
jgi:hypothetical protein